ncbi:MAG: hypothetical protein Q9172_004928 [Xanthocarpia lactea]
MEIYGQIEDCLDKDFGPGELPYLLSPYLVVIDMTLQVTRLPLLKQDGAHTRFVKGGVRPGRGSDDLRPPSLQTGQTSIFDILKEGPPPSSDSPSTGLFQTKSDSTAPKKESVANKASLGSFRRIFSPKQKASDSKSSTLELKQAFRTLARLDTGNDNAAERSRRSDSSSLSSATAETWERDLAAQISLPGFKKAYGVAPHQIFGEPGSCTFSEHERETSKQKNTRSDNKKSVITPSDLGGPVGLEHANSPPSPCGYPLPVDPALHPVSGRIYGQPPLEMVPPVNPPRVTKEHLNLLSYPSLSREAIAQLPKELVPNLPIVDHRDFPIHYGQLGPRQFSPGHRNGPLGQGITDDVKTLNRQPSTDHFKDSSKDSRPQSPPLPELRHESTQTSVDDDPKTPDDFLGHSLPDLKYKKNGRIKKYKEDDPMMVELGFLAIAEIYGRQAAIDRFAGPGIIKAATWETQRAIAKEEEELIGLGISSPTSTQSFGDKETRHGRGYSDESYGSKIYTPVTPRSGNMTPQTPKEFQVFYENLYKTVSEDDSCPKKIHGDFGLSSSLPHIHEDDPSAAQSPFSEPHIDVQPTMIPYALEAPGCPPCGRSRKHSRPKIHDIERNADVTSSTGKIQGYFRGCTPDTIRDTRLSMSTKDRRLQVLSQVREITGTRSTYRNPAPGQAKHPNHARQFNDRNLQCIDHKGKCGVCEVACCVYYEAIEASKDAVTAYGKEFAHEVGRSISEACLYADDLTTFLRCAECTQMVCPDCIGLCPIELCRLLVCKGSKRHVTHHLRLGRRSFCLARKEVPPDEQGAPTHIANMRTFDDTFSGEKIYPGKGKLYVRGDSKIFRFQNGKTESLFLQRKNPRRIAWTTLYRRQHKKGISEEVAKKRTRRTVKQQRGIVGASLDVIKERRSQRPEARIAARQEAIKAGKEKKSTAESKKKMEKAKSAAGAARGQAGRMVSKQGAKGAPSKASGKVR